MFDGVVEGDGVMLRGLCRGLHEGGHCDGPDHILELGVLARELLVGAVLGDEGAQEWAQILTQLDAHKEDEAVHEDHAEQHREVHPFPSRRLDAIHLFHHVPAWDRRANRLPIENEVAERQTLKLV